MATYFVGILAMIGGFVAMIVRNYAGAYCLFGYMFILWCLHYKEICRKD